MALFTDGPVSSIEEMTARDSQLLTVANVEGIDVSQKLTLAQDEIALELNTLLTRLSYVNQLFWVSPQPNIGSVVVTPPLKLWHTLRTLELVYADAYNSQLNDRYAGKRDQFHEMAKWAYEKLVETGIGIASFPLPEAATPQVATAAGTPPNIPLPDGTYYVTMAWTNLQGEEGACAIPATITTSMSTLVAQPGTAPQSATGWNVYVGIAPDAMRLQNDRPIATGQTWLQPGALAAGGRAPGSGQSPSYVKPAPRMIQRG
ncbi:MAG: hypothetical protein LAQ69_34645 [Acidobacteriia bacterium]|nr:hypothetical protein [Terriglobia bacterium]